MQRNHSGNQFDQKTIDSIGDIMPSPVLWDIDNEWRKINFIFDRLYQSWILKKHIDNSTHSFSMHEKQRILNELIHSLDNKSIDALNVKLSISIPKNNQAQPREIKKILDLFFKKNCLDEESISWINEKDKYLIEYLWGYINMAKQPINEKFLKIPVFYRIVDDERDELKQTKGYRLVTDEELRSEKYKELKMNLRCEDRESKYKLIIIFFDLLPLHFELKQQQIEKIRNDWVSLKNRNRLLYWLEQNQDLTEWSLLYIKNNFLYKRLPRWATNIDGLEGYEREKEIKIALSTVYNLIDSKEARSLLMNLMTRAGVQHLTLIHK